MDTFLHVFLTIIGFAVLAILYLACTAPEGWQDSLGFHEGREMEIDFTHGEAN